MTGFHAYRCVQVRGPWWEPLEWAADRAGALRGNRGFDPDWFMYGGRLVSEDGEPDLHLYKHGHTRRYLNVDESHRVFGFRYSEEHEPGRSLYDDVVYYERLRSLSVAIDLLDLHLMAGDPKLSRRSAVGGDNVIPLQIVC